MRVLVTRPQPEAERTAGRLAALGHTALCAPVIEIVARAARLPERLPDAVLATSGQAIALLDANAAHALHPLPLYVVGERSAALARATGFTDVRPPAPDARRLAAVLAAEYPLPAAFLYLAGRDRKRDLETALAAGGHRIEVVVVYAAEAAAALPRAAGEALRKGEIDAILHYSRRSAAIFRRLADTAELRRAAGRVRHVCISADAASALTGWAARLVVAARPNEAALLAALGTPDEG